jgi:hypothetical protein
MPAMEDRRDFNKILTKQEEVSALKIQFAKENKMDVTKSQWIGALYAHQKYNSPRCQTATQAFKKFDSLISISSTQMGEGSKFDSICRFGWEEAHHPWSKNGCVYTPAKLLKHLTIVVIPLQQQTKNV